MHVYVGTYIYIQIYNLCTDLFTRYDSFKFKYYLIFYIDNNKIIYYIKK